jgi:predicted metalloprotease with PDZ domain
VRLRAIRALVINFVLSGVAFAQTPVHYTITLQSPERHLVRVVMEIPPGRESHELQLPVWNALYQVRDFAQYINWIRAQDPTGQTLELISLSKSRWRLSGAESGARIEYEIFADSPDPYGAQLNSQHAFFNLAEILLYAEDERGDPFQIEFRNIPPGWKIATPLESVGEGYEAKNYDQIVDSPVEIGGFAESDFSNPCGTYRVLIDPGSAATVFKTIVPPIQRIVAAATSWMNDCPFQKYMFVYHVADSGGGGMEHAYGTAITLSAKTFTDDLDSFTGITAHEFFHLWNVKRLRPQSLEPIDYTKENYTTALWFSEGVDSTAGDYIRLRAGLLDEKQYLAHLSRQISELENRPAHLRQSAEQSSLDAWLEKYPYYGLPERSISYYNKGELLGVLLDLAMRDASSDHAGLRDLFRSMNQQYVKRGQFFADSAAIEESAEAVSHADLHEFFQKYVAGVDEIPWDRFFQSVGLRVVSSEVTLSDVGFEAVRRFDLPLTVVKVNSGSEAERAGLRTDDVIVQFNGKPVGRNFRGELADLSPGSTLRLLVRRDEGEFRLQWKVGSRSMTVFQLKDVPNITPEQKARRASWLFDKGAPKR